MRTSEAFPTYSDDDLENLLRIAADDFKRSLADSKGPNTRRGSDFSTLWPVLAHPCPSSEPYHVDSGYSSSMLQSPELYITRS